MVQECEQRDSSILVTHRARQTNVRWIGGHFRKHTRGDNIKMDIKKSVRRAGNTWPKIWQITVVLYIRRYKIRFQTIYRDCSIRSFPQALYENDGITDLSISSPNQSSWLSS
jgi:hypothetical protein